MSDPFELSRRERQIMDIIYQRGEVSAADVQEELPDAPSYSAVRTLLRILLEKKQVTFRKEGPRYLYRARVPRNEARVTAARRMMDVFFDNSVADAVSTLLDVRGEPLSEEELTRLQQMIEQAREEGR